MMSGGMAVREATPDDREAFLAMWDDFVSLDPDEPGNREMGETNWSRVMDSGNALKGMIAVDETGAQKGFVLYLTFPFTWSVGDACYLQDLYVHPDNRGTGMARAIVDALADLGRAEGWFKIFWMTQHDNYVAQKFYEKFADRKDYIRYDLTIGTP